MYDVTDRRTNHETATDLLTPPFATKVAILLRDDLAAWQRMNVTAFLASGIAAANPELVSEPYRDGDDGTYLPLLGMPVLVFEGGARELANARNRAVSRGLRPAIYTQEMFSTGYDAANRAATAGVPAEELDLVGLAVHGPKNGVDKILKGAHLHP
ncbi:MAG TPA: DUF2000 domain-containing protein [Flexivirga sp.]|uniref:DUF2000 domain-containing protein n=1 Tax=Flexivirga sp. TaxID=1962927 RepID=UPI002C86FD2C|nr:DUF2000 domain-containing protein [Flexivirga sp.]HWC20966.1 DUF2000 domain-containing protein [Flexivirga sp.]